MPDVPRRPSNRWDKLSTTAATNFPEDSLNEPSSNGLPNDFLKYGCENLIN